MKTCLVCKKKVKAFHKNSHVLPEWSYSELYDDLHRVAAMDLENLSDEQKQKGMRGSYWCVDCESNSSSVDKYGAIVFASRDPNSKEAKKISKTSKVGTVNRQGVVHEVRYEYWEGLDAPRLHKFANLCAIRGELGYRERKGRRLTDTQLENMIELYRTDRPDVDQMPLQIFKLVHNEGLANSVLLPFINQKSENLGQFVEFHLSSFLFQLYLKPINNDPVADTFLKQNGSMYVCFVPYAETGTIKKSLPKLGAIISKSRIRPRY